MSFRKSFPNEPERTEKERTMATPKHIELYEKHKRDMKRLRDDTDERIEHIRKMLAIDPNEPRLLQVLASFYQVKVLDNIDTELETLNNTQAGRG